MIYLMHVCAAQVTLAGTPSGDSEELRAMADGSNLSTLAFSERGSRSHFWAPVSQLDGRGCPREKSFVTLAGHADSSSSPRAPPGGDADRVEPVLVRASATGITLGGAWDGLGLRGNASAPMTFDIDIEGETSSAMPGRAWT